MSSLIVRNIKVFFRDKAAVFFSLMAVLIIVALYVFFLGDVWTSGMKDIPQAAWLMSSWIMAGLVAVTTLTTTLGAFGIMVDDYAKNIRKDFYSSPLPKSAIIAAYIIGALCISLILALITLVLSQLYIIGNGGHLLDIADLAKTLALVLLSSLSSSALVLLVVSFIKSQNAFGTVSSILGTLVGFLTGIYIPIGNLPEGVQWIIRVFPLPHAASLLRQVMMKVPINEAFAGAPSGVVEAFNKQMGIQLYIGQQPVSTGTSIAILIVSVILFYVLALWNVSRKAR